MYPVDIYLVIIAIDGLLSIFAVFAKGSDYYKDIAALAFASFLSVYLAMASVSGTAMGSDGTPIMDDGLMWLFIIIATIQGIFLLLELVEAYEEHVAGKNEKEHLIS